MKVTIELIAGPSGKEPVKNDMDKNIKALRSLRFRTKELTIEEMILVTDTISILEAIKTQLPTRE